MRNPNKTSVKKQGGTDNDRYEELLELIRDVIFTVTPEGLIIELSNAFESYTGWKVSEWIGKSFLNLVHPEDIELIVERLSELNKGIISTRSIEVRIFKKTGDFVYSDILASPKISNGKVIKILGIAREITMKKLAEEALLVSEKRYRKLFDVSRVAGELIREYNSRLELAMQSASMAWWGMDILTGQVTFDKRKSVMLGFPADKFKHYTDFMSLVHPDDYDRVMNAMKSYLSGTSDRYVCEYRMITKWGKYLWFYDVGTIVKRDTKGAPLNLVGIIIDITERKETENELFRAKEKAEKNELDLKSLNQHLLQVRENERALISREIHDQLGQSLTALKIDIDWLLSRPSLENEVMAKLKGMIDLVTITIKDVQRISSDLRPSILDDLGLASAMEWYCEDFSNRTGLPVRMEFENVQFVDMNHNLALFRVLQESLTNIIRHAGAKTASVMLFKSRHKINLVVQDDGKGIPSDKIRSSDSLGIMGMFERIKYAGGEMNIIKPAAGGTKISVVIPLKTSKL